VYAPQDVPLSPTTNVDGYALRRNYHTHTCAPHFDIPHTATDKPGIYKVLTSATHPLGTVVPADSIYRINTGGPLPAGTDTVIMVEDTRLVSTLKNSANQDIEEETVETLVQLPAGENVRAPGSDIRKADLVLHRGDVIRSIGGEIGTLAFVGRSEVGSCLLSPHNVHGNYPVRLPSIGDLSSLFSALGTNLST
jgi:gephyrin